jgi:asparagine synthetase B (glutamine-hydrolysing)
VPAKSLHPNSIPDPKSGPLETVGNKNRRAGLTYTLSWHNEAAKNSRELDSTRSQALFLILLLPLRESSRLAGEQHTESLVGFRKAESPEKELEVSLNLNKESKRNFRFAANLIAGVPTLLQIKAIADYQSSIQAITEYSLTYKVIF